MQTWKDYFDFGGDYLPQHEDYFSNTRTQQEIDFLVQHVIPSKKATILDLACGQARHTIALTQLGYHVLGVDRSEQLLTMAHKAAEENKVTLELVKQDMRQLNLDRTFDVITLLFCTFGIEPDKINKKIVQRLEHHLNPGGILFFDMHNLFRFTRRMRQTETAYAVMDLPTLTLWDKSPQGLELPLRLYTVPEMAERLAPCGVTIKSIWGSYDPKQPNYSFDSERLLLLCQKER